MAKTESCGRRANDDKGDFDAHRLDRGRLSGAGDIQKPRTKADDLCALVSAKTPRGALMRRGAVLFLIIRILPANAYTAPVSGLTL